jgi:hypothetical protein
MFISLYSGGEGRDVQKTVGGGGAGASDKILGTSVLRKNLE